MNDANGMVRLPSGWLIAPADLARPCPCGSTWKWVAEKCVRCARCLPPGRDDRIFGWVDCHGRRITRNPPAEMGAGR